MTLYEKIMQIYHQLTEQYFTLRKETITALTNKLLKPTQEQLNDIN